MSGSATLHTGQCHCGDVHFQVTLHDGFASARRCTCSYCRMRGAVALSVRTEDFKILRGENALTLYKFNTGAARHYFCSRCGIYTHHLRRSNQSQYGVNAACLDSVSPFDFPEIPVLDGVNHPNDTGGALRQTGILRFVSTA